MTVTVSRDVVIVCNNIDEAGGAQRWARSMGDLLSAEGHRVLLVGVAGVSSPHDYTADHDGPLPYRTALLHDKPVHAAPRPSIDARLRHPKAGLKHRSYLRLQQSGADRLSTLLAPLDPASSVIICVQVFAMEWITKADTRGIPVIGMSHESYAASMASSRGTRVKKLYANLPRFVALTDQDARDWTTKGGMNNAAVMPNPLPFPATGGADPETHVCVALGRLSQEKGFDLLLEAWSYVVKARPGTDWRLKIYGDGPDRAALEAQAAELEIASSVSFEGPTSQVPEALRSGSIFVSTSRAEGFPMTLLEALACGLPCVAFDCAPGVREILRDGTLVSLGNTEAFADQLGKLIDDGALRGTLAKAAPESVARYSPDAIAERWERLFALVHR
ncbi:glycosyltransferase [Actinospica sp.]|uniref:glycosyltransferase n=1 Tax=Actinospica sp. TaxID=1872142 RepID=UPI002B812664|nr:glycosyltransferase [Actinospica sp.]HWG24900.1 glycosyltransferase [Actinospica sp.]